MGHKKYASNAQLRFPSGRVRQVTSTRRTLAKTLCEIPGNGWHRLAVALPDDAAPWLRLRSIQAAKREGRAAASLERMGMIERHPTDATCVRWSLLHERPMFGADKESHLIYGHHISSISPEQKELLTLTMMAHGRKMRHEVLTLNDPAMQRRIRSLVKRGILTVTKRESVWSLGLGERYAIPNGTIRVHVE